MVIVGGFWVKILNFQFQFRFIDAFMEYWFLYCCNGVTFIIIGTSLHKTLLLWQKFPNYSSFTVSPTSDYILLLSGIHSMDSMLIVILKVLTIPLKTFL